MSAELKQEGSGISALGPVTAHDIPYIGGISDGGDIDEKSDKDWSPTDSETAIDQLDKEGHVGDDFVIRTGADASKHLLSLRDDEDPVLTFRSAILGTAFACFQAAMNQIYNFKPTNASVSGAFMVLFIFFIGKAWSILLPRGDRIAARWRASNPDKSRLPLYITLIKFINPHSFGLKEHAIASITASSASQGSLSVVTFTVQRLFYEGNPLNAATVILGILSISLFGYGLTGLLRPVTVWAPEAVYWTNIPLVTTLQSLHWEDFRSSKRIRYFWYSFGGMTAYQVLPAYIMPWLNSVSIPCLASQKATGSKAALLTNLFGGSLSNEGLGILNFSFDWQYITSTATSQPIGYHLNAAFGLFICWIAYIGVYYSNLWNSRALPFMASNLRTADGGRYNASTVFINGILDRTALERVGLPRLTGSYAWSLTVGNAAIGALIAHVILFWRKDVWASIKAFRTGVSEDRHHAAMLVKYKEVPTWWYFIILTVAFVFGIIVTTTQNITMPVWSYIIALLTGAFVAPFSTILYSRYGSGIATNSLMKIVAGAVLPGRPLANLYFSSWSHSVISQSLNMASDLKMGEYLKIPPRIMFLTQTYGTIVGLFINYVVSVSIVTSHRELLFDTHGNYAWSGAFFQSQNTAATTWALSRDMFRLDGDYFIIPVGLGLGVLIVLLHAGIAHFLPRVGTFQLSSINVPLILVFSGYLATTSPQSCTMLSGLLVPIFVQSYLRVYKPRIFKEYSYLVTAAFDGGSLLVMFILSFAVFGAAGNGAGAPFPNWWGNKRPGYPDHCPSPPTA